MGVSVPRRSAAVGKNHQTDRSLIEHGPFFPRNSQSGPRGGPSHYGKQQHRFIY